jgi:hypothetical protein
MVTILDLPWTTERFLAWEDQQEGRHEFDGQRVIAMTGGSVAHQEIMFNLRLALGRLPAGAGSERCWKCVCGLDLGSAVPTC